MKIALKMLEVKLVYFKLFISIQIMWDILQRDPQNDSTK